MLLVHVMFSPGDAATPASDMTSQGDRRRRSTSYCSSSSSRRNLGLKAVLLVAVLLSMMHSAEAVIIDSKESMAQEVALEGKRAVLPCETSSPGSGDHILLTIWYKEGITRPIFSVDTRRPYTRMWVEEALLGSRAYFSTDEYPPYLQIDPVFASDAGVYVCRVDYRRKPTQKSSTNLSIIVPPGEPTILDNGIEVDYVVGPYDEGSNITITCQVTGGQPTPQVIWLQGDRILDDEADARNSSVVSNELTLGPLTHENLDAMYECQTVNSDLVDPISTIVTLDVNVRPLTVQILGPLQPLTSGVKHNVVCESTGARPPALITWWLDDQQLTDVHTHKENEENVTKSTLMFVPETEDGGKLLRCIAKSPVVSHTPLEDTWELEIHYAPLVDIEFGAEVDPENVREGDNATFLCRVQANPSTTEVKWFHKGLQVQPNKTAGVVVTRSKLKLTFVERQQAGLYTCVASNSIGAGDSQPLVLTIKYVPVCSDPSGKVIGAAKQDEVEMLCRVNASPSQVSFRWYFRSPESLVNISAEQFTVQDRTSLLTYRVHKETDYGEVLCFAMNDMGEQSQPCTFTVVPAGKPDALENCTLTNETTDTLFVMCLPGYDGGLEQDFTVEVFEFDGKSRNTVLNLTENDEPTFTIEGLHPGASYLLAMYSKNVKGKSEQRILHGFTLPSPPDLPPTIPSTHIFPITPILGVLIGVVGALVLVAIVVVVVMKLRGDARRSKERPESGLKVPHAPLHHSKDGDDGPDVIFCRTVEPTYEDVDGIPPKLKHANIYETFPYDSKDKNSKISESSDRDDVEYAELTFNNGKTKQKKSTGGGGGGGANGAVIRSDSTIYATIDHARTAQHQQQQEQQQQGKQQRQQPQGKKTAKQTHGDAESATQRDPDQIPLMDAALESSV
ncbi:nephrin-like [Panulirus ornatus]|uniref:nephrin-like n=1 Tax=Panulirus ornatus TaxID=150431 RepID=UPI003A849D53